MSNDGFPRPKNEEFVDHPILKIGRKISMLVIDESAEEMICYYWLDKNGNDIANECKLSNRPGHYCLCWDNEKDKYYNKRQTEVFREKEIRPKPHKVADCPNEYEEVFWNQYTKVGAKDFDSFKEEFIRIIDEILEDFKLIDAEQESVRASYYQFKENYKLLRRWAVGYKNPASSRDWRSFIKSELLSVLEEREGTALKDNDTKKRKAAFLLWMLEMGCYFIHIKKGKKIPIKQLVEYGILKYNVNLNVQFHSEIDATKEELKKIKTKPSFNL